MAPFTEYIEHTRQAGHFILCPAMANGFGGFRHC